MTAANNNDNGLFPWLNARKCINVNNADNQNYNYARMRHSTFRALQRCMERLYEDHDFREVFDQYDAIAYTTTRMECSWKLLNVYDDKVIVAPPDDCTDDARNRVVMSFMRKTYESGIQTGTVTEERRGCVAPGWRLIFNQPCAAEHNRFFVIKKVEFALDHLMLTVDGIVGNSWKSTRRCDKAIHADGEGILKAYDVAITATQDEQTGKYSVSTTETNPQTLTCTTVRLAQQLKFVEIPQSQLTCKWFRVDYSGSVQSFAIDGVDGVTYVGGGGCYYCAKRKYFTATPTTVEDPDTHLQHTTNTYTWHSPTGISSFDSQCSCAFSCDKVELGDAFTEDDVRKLLQRFWADVPAMVKQTTKEQNGELVTERFYHACGTPSILCAVGGLVPFRKETQKIQTQNEIWYVVGNIYLGKHYPDSCTIVPFNDNWSENLRYKMPTGDGFGFYPRLGWSPNTIGGQFIGRTPSRFAKAGTRRHSQKYQSLIGTRIIDKIERDTAHDRTKVYLRQVEDTRTLDDGRDVFTDENSDGYFTNTFNRGGGPGFLLPDHFGTMAKSKTWWNGSAAGQVRQYDDVVFQHSGVDDYRTQVVSAVCCDAEGELQHWDGNGSTTAPNVKGFIGYAAGMVTRAIDLDPLAYRDSVTVEGALPLDFVPGDTVKFYYTGMDAT